MEYVYEIRYILLKSLLIIFINTLITFINRDFILNNIIFAPLNCNFISYNIINKTHNIKLYNTNILGQFNICLKISIINGIIISFPLIVYDLWHFIYPALYENEKVYIKKIFFILIVSLLISIVFGYFILIPMVLQTSQFSLINDYNNNIIINIFDLEDYLDIFIYTILYTSIVFMIPIPIYMNRKNLVLKKIITKYYKELIILIIFLIFAIIPGDITNSIIIIIPFFILSIILLFASR